MYLILKWWLGICIHQPETKLEIDIEIDSIYLRNGKSTSIEWQDKKLVSRDYYDAYAQREDMLREGGDKFYQT